VFGSVTTAHAWSTSKVPVLVTLLHDDERNGRSPSAPDRAYAQSALEESDNASIEALFSELETIHGGLVPASETVQAELRQAGDETTVINVAPNNEGFTTYGQTPWSVAGEVTFYRSLANGCLLDPADTSYVLGLMRSVIPSQRWGAGEAGYPPSLPIALKGGWGPSNGLYQVRQTAIIGSGRQGYVMAMLALPASGQFADGVNMVTALAQWARRNLIVENNETPLPCRAS
jgi:hypothetical protein